MREDHENGEETKVDSTTTPTPGLKGDLVQQHTAKAAMEDLVSLLACMDELRVVLIMLHKGLPKLLTDIDCLLVVLRRR